MKKPNITQVEWLMHPVSPIVYSILKGENINICDICLPKDDIYQEYNNAQAISAVPEMIDALIESHTQITIALSHEEPIPTQVLIEWASQIEFVLEKAGVDL